MSNFANILVVNEEIAKAVESISTHETMKEMDRANLTHLATALFLYKIRNGKKSYIELVKNIVILALVKNEYNKMFGIVDNNDDKISYNLNTQQNTNEMAKELINTFVNNTNMRRQLIGLIVDELDQFNQFQQQKQATVAK